jgi:hypothetical protein
MNSVVKTRLVVTSRKTFGMYTASSYRHVRATRSILVASKGVVHLFFDGTGELFDDFNGTMESQFFNVPFGKGRQVEHDLEIDLHQFANLWPLYLHGHLLAVFQPGTVNLSYGG